MARFKLVSNVSEFGLFRSVARTRLRLVIVTVVVSAITIATGLLSTTYIMERSSSVGLNIVIITGLMMLAMIASYLQAVLIGDLAFKGPWREQVILGERPWKHDINAEVVVSNHNAEFMILLVGLVIGNALLINFSGGGFLDRYHEEGFFHVRMRSEAESERIAALRDMADPTQFDLWENPNLHAIVTRTISEDPSPEVRAQAAWNAGVMKIITAREALITVVEDASQPAKTREEAAVALGRIAADERSQRAMEEALVTAKDDPTRLAMLRGLGTLARPGSYAKLAPLLQAGAQSEEVMIYAFWVIQQAQDPEAHDFIRAELGDDTPEQGVRLCALLDALKMVAREDDVSWARKEFMIAPQDVACERVAWEERDERLHTILYSDTLRTKYVKIVANSGQGTKYRAWFETIAHDSAQSWPLREAAAAIIKQIDQIGLH